MIPNGLARLVRPSIIRLCQVSTRPRHRTGPNAKGHDMQLRELANNNTAVVTIGAIVVLVVALTILWRQIAGGGPGSADYQAYYVDLNTGQIITANANQHSPIDLSSEGGDPGLAARAIVFACGECANEQDRFIAWVEKYPDEIKQKLDELKAQSTEQGGGPMAGPPSFMQMDYLMMNKLVSPFNLDNPTKMRWVAVNSPAGTTLMNGIREPCPDGSRPAPCRPGK